MGILGASDYWLRFKWQHYGSPLVHGLAWLKDAPDVQRIWDPQEDGAEQDIIQYVDKLVSTTNPAVLPDGAMLQMLLPPKQIPTSVTRHTLTYLFYFIYIFI